MTCEDQITILQQGVEAWNQWRTEHPGMKPNLNDVNLSGIHFGFANLSDATLSETNLNDAKLSGVNLSDVVLIGAHLSGANLCGANLSGADLTGADLTGANMSHARLNHARFTNANMSRANLDGATLDGADLHHARLTAAQLTGASIRDANLTEVDFGDARLVDSDLRGASLGGSTFRHADLRRCKLDDCHAWGINLSDALLDGADFRNASMFAAIFGNNDLSNTRWLDTVRHRGPSTIGIDTIHASRGIIPEGFLRGAGVPDSFIAQIPALINSAEAVPFWSCFIKYSRREEEFARLLHSQLRTAHVRAWFAPEDIDDGGKLRREIDVMLSTYDKLILVLSPESLHSDWLPVLVQKVSKEEEADGSRKLFPIRLMDKTAFSHWMESSETNTGLVTKLQTHRIPDFSRWTDSHAFNDALARLLTELK